MTAAAAAAAPRVESPTGGGGAGSTPARADRAPRDDMPSQQNGKAAVGWVASMWRPLVSEAVSTALLVALGCATLVPGGSEGLTAPAFGFGFVVLANVMAFGPASGAHMNPAVSLAAALSGCLGWGAAAAYALAQCLGAVLGFGLLLWIRPFGGGWAAPAEGVGALQAVVVEALLTGVLALACCALWAAHDPAAPDHAAPVKLGLVIAGLVYAGGRFTGASLNPARSLAPAIWQSVWTSHWVYWVGPLGGAALAALLHRYVLAPPRPAPPRAAAPAPEELPLHNANDKNAC